MAILYQKEDISFPSIKRKAMSRWIKQVVERNNRRVGDITCIFCSDAKILEINRKYLKHDYYTDIITFDYTGNNQLSGDLFISLDTVKTNSDKFKTNYDDELRRVMIHGILHLCGYNDSTKEEKEMIRIKENESLKLWDNNL